MFVWFIKHGHVVYLFVIYKTTLSEFETVRRLMAGR
jgi:hypothetical protein